MEPSPDLAIGSWSDRGPWVVDTEAMPWRADVARRRAQARDQVPIWLQPGTFPPAGRVARVVGRVGAAVAGWYLIDWRRGVEAGRRGISRRLRHAFAALGPTYIKLGQIISGGEGLFPPELVQEFKLLRDRVPPEPFDDVRRVVELDLGRSLDDVFERFERTPIAAASIAQVHAARLRTGEEVVVKVQRPQVAARARRRPRDVVARRLVGRIPVAALATRRRSSSCSRKRSSRSSTSARSAEHARHRAASPRPTSGRRSSRGAPDARHSTRP
jgi:ubiquinone biosynthesis protein